MSDRMYLGCAECGKVGTLSEDVTVEATGYRTGKPYVAAGGKVEVEYGCVEDADFNQDVIATDEISCGDCGARFDDWQDATKARVYEYRCATCGWWGRQDWLHGFDNPCEGELEKLRTPSLPLDQGALAA
jgi:DNA-directed RNA polymerase subunit RPC12/RpoP